MSMRTSMHSLSHICDICAVSDHAGGFLKYSNNQIVSHRNHICGGPQVYEYVYGPSKHMWGSSGV